MADASQITFRNAKSINDQIVQSNFVENQETGSEDRIGLLRCWSCDACPHIQEVIKIHSPNSSWHSLGDAINCATVGVIYIFHSKCGCFYVGKTIIQLRVSVLEHVYSICIGDLSTTLGRHTEKIHKY